MPPNAEVGRPKGAPNKLTAIAKDAIANAAEMLGGTARLAAWAKEDPQNERAFWSTIYPKLLSVQLSHSGQIDLTATKEQRDASVAAFARADS